MSTSTENIATVDIDKLTGILREKIKDPYLGKSFIKKALTVMPERQLHDIAEFSLREGNHPGRLFVSVCSDVMREHGIVITKRYGYQRGI